MIYEMYRKQGGVTIRYDFADVYVNGVYLGVFAVEEFMEKRVIENSLQREGPIVKVNEDPVFIRGSFYNKLTAPYQDYSIFSQNKTIQSSNLNGYASYAVTLVNKFLYQDEPIENVFDVNKYLKLYAILELFSATHGRDEHNMRHYYNPVTGLLEPVPFDESAFLWHPSKDFMREDILANYKRTLKKYIIEFAIDYPNFIERHKNSIYNYTTTIQRDNQNFKMDVWKPYGKIEQLKSIDKPISPPFIRYNATNHSYELTIKNEKPIDIKITEILQNGSNIINECNLSESQASNGSFKDGILMVNEYKEIIVTIPSDKISNPNGVSIVWQTDYSEKDKAQCESGEELNQ